MAETCHVFILAYPDNPVGNVFLREFMDADVSVSGVIVENKNTKSNWKRFKKKVKKDGFWTAIKRFFQVFLLK